jgi:hypothetical protein
MTAPQLSERRVRDSRVDAPSTAGVGVAGFQVQRERQLSAQPQWKCWQVPAHRQRVRPHFDLISIGRLMIVFGLCYPFAGHLSYTRPSRGL